MATKKRITLEVEPELQKRLKVTVAHRGTTIREYCEKAIRKELDTDEASRPE